MSQEEPPLKRQMSELRQTTQSQPTNSNVNVLSDKMETVKLTRNKSIGVSAHSCCYTYFRRTTINC
jgi:hypothetical protein